MVNIILCGGSGTRLWPLSRKFYPKQFLKIFNSESLFEKTLKRNSNLCDKTIVITNNEQYYLALDQVNGTKYSEFILEPIGRNTTAAITLACLALNPKDIVLVTPSDHLIKNKERYIEVLKQAKKYAKDGYLVTFGIKPDSPNTNYGYIEASGNDVVSFKEKPDKKTAELYLEKGNYYWNSGMFSFEVEAYLKELKKYAPKIFETCNLAYMNAEKEKPLRIQHDDMAKIPSISIDYSVMEKSNKLKIIPSDIDWSDLGSFEALYESFEKDNNGNVLSSNKVLVENSNNNLVISKDRVITTIDINDFIIVDTDDTLLISKNGSSHKVKGITKKLEEYEKKLIETHETIHRPWGSFITLEEGYRFKVKKISVNPGGRLSLQKHFHRSEYWTVVNGTAKVVLDNKEIMVNSNESIYIPLGSLHRVENPGKIELVIIETQIGDYLEEDDIVRIEDDYRRTN